MAETWRRLKNARHSSDILADEKSFAGLTGFLIRRYADRVTHRSEGDQHHLTLHFEH